MRTYLSGSPFDQVLLLLVFLDDFTAYLALGGISEAHDGVCYGLVPRHCVLAIGAFYVIFGIFI